MFKEWKKLFMKPCLDFSKWLNALIDIVCQWKKKALVGYGQFSNWNCDFEKFQIMIFACRTNCVSLVNSITVYCQKI